MMVRELGFEMKAQPSEKLKSAEELAREERQRLQTLEVLSSCCWTPEEEEEEEEGLTMCVCVSGRQTEEDDGRR